MSGGWDDVLASPGSEQRRRSIGGTPEVLAVRRARTLLVLVAMVCALFAGSTSVAAAGGPSIGTASPLMPTVAGKRWQR
jgi:hypothetical protein